ncbi:MAG: hypothetical protein ACR2F6_04470 [Mycobacteriales bacterium]
MTARPAWPATGPGQLLAAIREIDALRNWMDGLFTVLLAAAEQTQLALAGGNRSLALLLAEHTRLPVRAARDMVRVATATQPDPGSGRTDYPRLGELLRHGEPAAPTPR